MSICHPSGVTRGSVHLTDVYNAKNGKYTAREDFSYRDSDGNTKNVKKGDPVNIPENQRKEFKEAYGDKIKVRAGTVGQKVGGAVGKMGKAKDELIEKFSPASVSSENKSKDTANSDSNTNSQNKTTDKTQNNIHDKSPFVDNKTDYSIDLWYNIALLSF